MPNSFDETPLLNLLKHPSDKVRYLSVKNLAKISKASLLDTYINLINTDNSSIVRRESVSVIGRLRNPITKATQIKLLKDNDPEVVLQSIRGLLIFKQDEHIKTNY